MVDASTAGPFVPEPLRPRAVWYWVGGLAIVAAVGGAVAWLVFGFVNLADTVDDLERVPFPAGGVVVIDDPGGQVIYAEGGGSAWQSEIVVIAPDGRTIAVADYGGSLTYDFGGRSGMAVGTFEAPVEGEYLIEPQPFGRYGPATLAVGPSIGRTLVGTIVGTFVIGGFGVLLGLLVIAVTAIRRSRADRDRRPPGGPPQYWPSPTPQWPAGNP